VVVVPLDKELRDQLQVAARPQSGQQLPLAALHVHFHQHEIIRLRMRGKGETVSAQTFPNFTVNQSNKRVWWRHFCTHGTCCSGFIQHMAPRTVSCSESINAGSDMMGGTEFGESVKPMNFSNSVTRFAHSFATSGMSFQKMPV
jgi:hypothetical protein